MLTTLGPLTTNARPVVTDRALTAEERRLLADRPPHHGELTGAMESDYCCRSACTFSRSRISASRSSVEAATSGSSFLVISDNLLYGTITKK